MAGGAVHPFSGFTLSICQLRPEARGYVRLRSPDPREPPSMQPNYLSTDLDRLTTVARVKLARALAGTRSVRPLVAQEVKPGPKTESDDDLLKFVRDNGAMIVHPSGTCKMAPESDPM